LGEDRPIRRLLTLPNILTMFRLVSAPMFLALFFGNLFPDRWEWLRLWLCLGLVILSEASDVLDGYFARKYGQVSDFGRLMDPYADSAFRLTVLFSFAGHAHRWMPLWMVVVLLYRDILTSVLRTFAMKRGVVVAARFSGKLKAVAEAAMIISILVVAASFEFRHILTEEVVRKVAVREMWVVLGIAIWSGLDYFWTCRKHMIPPESEEEHRPGAGGQGSGSNGS
jgi:CDP-diacylglycerol--glycerol-3-phosphate 3-phosphatidyltransferase